MHGSSATTANTGKVQSHVHSGETHRLHPSVQQRCTLEMDYGSGTGCESKQAVRCRATASYRDAQLKIELAAAARTPGSRQPSLVTKHCALCSGGAVQTGKLAQLGRAEAYLGRPPHRRWRGR